MTMTSDPDAGVAAPLFVRRRVDRAGASAASASCLRLDARRAATPSLSESSMTMGSCCDVLGVARPVGRPLVPDGVTGARPLPFARELVAAAAEAAGGGGGGRA